MNKNKTIYAQDLLKQFESWLARIMKSPRLKKAISYGLIFIIVAIGAGAYYMFHDSRVAEAAWWNDSWAYRKSVALTNSASDQANVYTQVTIDTSDTTRFNADCSDLRWTDINGNLLPYYIVSGCRTASTVVNVLFDNLISGSSTLYYYYGNPTASKAASLTNFTAVASSYAVGSIGSEEKGTGPVAYWSFDEGVGTVANDATSNKNNGTLTNMSATASSTSGWQTEDNCVSGKCLAFDGGNDYVDMRNAASLQLTGEITISFWAKAKNSGVAVGKGFTAYEIYPNWGTETGGYVGLSTGAHWYSIAEQRDMTHNVKIADWNYWVWVIKEGSYAKFYVNGRLIRTIVNSNFSIYDNTASLQLGRRSDGTSSFSGSIDELKLYNYERTAAQIKLDYNAGLAGTSGRAAGEGVGVSAGGRSAQWLTNGLVGQWKMDEAVGTWNGTAGEVKDWSGNGNNGTAAGTVGGTASTTVGKFGNAGSFDGTDDAVSVGTGDTLNLTGDLTISAWIKPKSYGGGNIGRIFDRSGAGTNGYSFMVDNAVSSNGLRFYGGNVNSYSNSNAAPLNQWTHVVIVHTGASVTFYSNGAVAGAGTNTAITGATGATGFIGNNSATGSGNRQFDGQIDDLRIYNRALSDREIRDLYNYAPGPVGWWKMEEGSGQYAYDTSGNSNNGTLGANANAGADDPIWTAGKFGKGLKFSANNTFALLPSANFFGSGKQTLSLWAKPKHKTAAARGFLFAHIETDTANRVYVIQLANGNIVASVGLSTQYIILNEADYSADQWLNLVIERDYENNKFSVWVNGIKKITDQSVAIATTNSAVSYIGGFLGTETFDGVIDDVKIYNYSRTPEQIMEDMNARGNTDEGGGATAAVSAVGKTAVGYWKFDEGYGTTAYDSSPQKNDGTIYGSATSTMNGKFNKALTFDGVNDYVSLASSPDVSNGLTYSVWFNFSGTPSSYSLIANRKTFLEIKSAASFYWFPDNSQSVAIITVPTMSAGTWYHAVVTQVGTAYNFYLNGSLVQGGTAGALNNAPTFKNIGSYDSTTWFMKGLIDEVKIYNFALTADDVRVEYNNGSSLKLGSFSTDSNGVASSSAASLYCVPGSTDACGSPVGEWKFEEGSGGTVNDTSGSGNTGTWAGTGSHWTTGKAGKAGKFNGSDDYVSLTSASAVNFTQPATIEAWVKSTSDTAQEILSIGKSTDSNLRQDICIGNGCTGTLTNEIITLGRNSDGHRLGYITTNRTELLDGKWHYITATYSGTIVKLYLDGVEKILTVGQGTNDGLWGNISGIDRAFIGAYFMGGASLNGSVDDLKIYNYARTAAQVAWDYNQGKPVGYWKLDEGQGGIAHDSSGNKNNGTIYPGTGGTQTATSTMWTAGASGKRNGSLNFDGTDDWISVPASASLTFTNQITMSAWVKRTAASNYSNIISIPYGATWVNPYTSFGLEFPGTSNILTVTHATSASTYTTAAQATTPGNGVWYHIVATYDGTKSSIYLNGVFVMSETSAWTPSNTQPLKIGAVGIAGSTYPFNGQIDDVRIYNYALTPVQVKTLYSGGAASFR